MFLKVQQRSVIRYYFRHDYINKSIHTKLFHVSHEAVLCLRAIEKLAAKIRGGQETIEDDSKPRRPLKSDLGDAVLRYLDKQPHSSLHEISKTLCPPKITILQIFHDLGLQFFAPRWIPHRLSQE
jgi:superfamily I DNA and/or RNA helicase